MIKAFQFSGIPKIIFGCGSLKKLPEIISGYGKRIILLTGRSSFMQHPYAAEFLSALSHKSVVHFHVIIDAEPTPEMIDKAVKDFRREKPEAVIAIGGGSVMDAGKAVSAMITVSDGTINYLEEIGTKEHPGSKIPFIAVPTTSGTGSEATKNAVISRTAKNGFKRSLRHDNFVPDIALVDPELTLSCPADVTAASGMDCFSQLTEAYLSTKAGVYTDALALEGIRAVKDSLLPAFLDGSNIIARTGMSFAALTSGICLANAGLGVVHGFASSVGGLYDIPHGLICGTLMAAANEVTVRELERSWENPVAYKKYAELGKIFADDRIRSDKYYIESFIAYLNELTQKLRLQGLASAGADKSAIDEICSNTGLKNNPVKLGKDALIEILTKRMV